MDLHKMLETHWLRDGAQIWKPDNPSIGLCSYCDNPLSEFGRTTTRCEYHWLKKKHSKIQSKCVGGCEYLKRDRHLEGIKCQIEWREFIHWAISHPEYKMLKDPAITRVDMSAHYTFDNMKWVEFMEVSKFHRQN